MKILKEQITGQDDAGLSFVLNEGYLAGEYIAFADYLRRAMRDFITVTLEIEGMGVKFFKVASMKYYIGMSTNQLEVELRFFEGGD